MTAYALAVIIRAMGIVRIGDGLMVGLVTGIGFAATAFATTFLFEHKPLGHWHIVSGYQIVYQVAAAVIITGWR